MFGLLNQDNMEQGVAEEFDRLERSVSTYLLTEHNEDGSHNMEPSGLGFVPIGAILLWPIAVAPSGWKRCNGSDINRTTFSALFGVIGTTYGVGDGSTTYTLPLIADVGTSHYIIFSGLGN
jgi:hypothetical protein